jgi:hypothetical protein
MDNKIVAAQNKVKARLMLEETLNEIRRMGLLAVVRDANTEVALDIWTSAYSQKVEIIFDEV